ncbi:MAG: hypothetical protein EBZ69_08100, partial [Alphaproteobacteria bacterium]|nr:hypothetical protein [Alphaproteobacteria bacterium]
MNQPPENDLNNLDNPDLESAEPLPEETEFADSTFVGDFADTEAPHAPEAAAANDLSGDQWAQGDFQGTETPEGDFQDGNFYAEGEPVNHNASGNEAAAKADSGTRKNYVPLMAGAAVLLAAVGIGGWFGYQQMFGEEGFQPVPARAILSDAPPPA